MRLVQYKDTSGAQHVAVVEDAKTLIPLKAVASTRELASIAISQGVTMIEAAKARRSPMPIRRISLSPVRG